MPSRVGRHFCAFLAQGQLPDQNRGENDRKPNTQCVLQNEFRSETAGLSGILRGMAQAFFRGDAKLEC